MFLGIFLSLFSAQSSEIRVKKDIEYARTESGPLALDLYLPPGNQQKSLIVWIHGGAWRSGSKTEMPLKEFVMEGHAAASIDYRLSPLAAFPAQIHDIKGAIRFLRAHARDLEIDPSKIVIAGSSAGGHLAALVGVTNNDRDLEGTVGGDLDQSSAVQGIISYFGAANLTTILAQSTPHGLDVRVPALKLLLGGSPEDKQELARQASPVFHIDRNDPPLLLFHGDQDPQMPVNQALELQGAYENAGAKVRLEIVHGSAHGGKAFFDAKRMEIARHFLNEIGNSRVGAPRNSAAK